MSWDDEAPAVIFDNGTGMFKAGFAGEEKPGQAFSSVVGYPKAGGTPQIGDSCMQPKSWSQLDLKYPMEHGIVTNWDDMEKIWEQAYKLLEVAPGNQPLLMTEAALNPRENREKMLELAFEKFKVPAAYVAIQATLSLCGLGRETGLVVDSGDGITHVVPVLEGFTVRNAILRMQTAGRDLTSWMMELLSNDCKQPFTTSADQEIARDIKEKLAFVSQDFDADMARIEADACCMDDEYKLPDGKTLYVGRPKFACPEALFQPEIMGIEEQGIHELCYESAQRCDIDMRRDLYSAVVLSGGSTMFNGMADRMKSELLKLTPPRAKVRVIDPPERKWSVWMGGALVASLSTFQQQWILANEYEECGASIVHRRCDALTSAISS
eukprot:NODE_559_length_1545_cov_257.117647_g420_i0.p1 GENE.NODE_559_length_1545_cov_257.117647_g420_i0~~NODE_559_length_1545_cov_257.117647_g420_i0.p1  ORF type:complete len:381 (-),score=103.07 NODE_559_length_1545_cov_257.117647_g420_i0:326-1468(-)